jgi:hypothetical protein
VDNGRRTISLAVLLAVLLVFLAAGTTAAFEGPSTASSASVPHLTLRRSAVQRALQLSQLSVIKARADPVSNIAAAIIFRKGRPRFALHGLLHSAELALLGVMLLG